MKNAEVFAMTNAFEFRGLMTAAALVGALFLCTGARSTAFAAPSDAASLPRLPVVRISQSDVAASNQKVGMAYGALVRMWTDDFKQIGARFAAPHIARYD